MAAGAQEKTPAEVFFEGGKLHLRSKDHRRFVQTEIENVDNYLIFEWELGFRYRKFLIYISF